MHSPPAIPLRRLYRVALVVAALFGLLSFNAAAQTAPPPDSLWTVKMPQVVVTATRTARTLRDVPIPTQVVTAQEIEAGGTRRLSDLLAEQTGLALVYDHGAGIQVQGLASDYTLILIDGEPVIGRTAGTLDLDRLTVADLERVEIVRGPSSSLYGSEALAGVINLITRKPADGFHAGADLHVETHQTLDLSADTDFRHNRLAGRFLLNRYRSGGYDLAPDVLGPTLPGFTDYTTSSRLTFEQNERATWNLSARLARQAQRSVAEVRLGETLIPYDDAANRTDWSLAPSFTYRFAPGVKGTLKGYASRYFTDLTLRDQNDGSVFSTSRFDQFYGKAEAQMDAIIGRSQLATFGSGYLSESVTADRVQGGRRSSTNVYGFAQHEWIASRQWTFILSARLDVHSDYATRLSPKAAFRYKPFSRLRLRASAGSGFKAPTFQQRYLDFTNPLAGYSVFGATDAVKALQQLDAQGQIVRFLTDITALQEIRPETAIAFNAGLEWNPIDRLELQLNFFRNNVSDLIEAAPVAVKPNGQQVFTYFNLNRIYTQGVEADFTLRPHRTVAVSLGYQYLDARDRDVLAALAEGSLYKRVNGRDRRVTRDEYGGLFNRSRHAGSLRVLYHSESSGFTVSLRGLYRGRYGFGDANGNLILDDASEYVPAYTLWHLTLTRAVGPYVSAQAGVKNLFDKTNPEHIPVLAGRLLFAGLKFNLRP